MEAVGRRPLRNPREYSPNHMVLATPIPTERARGCGRNGVRSAETYQEVRFPPVQNDNAQGHWVTKSTHRQHLLPVRAEGGDDAVRNLAAGPQRVGAVKQRLLVLLPAPHKRQIERHLLCQWNFSSSKSTFDPHQPPQQGRTCRSLLYVDGVPLTVTSRPTACPTTRPDLPRSSSRASGFFFCGISELAPGSVRRDHRPAGQQEARHEISTQCAPSSGVGVGESDETKL